MRFIALMIAGVAMSLGNTARAQTAPQSTAADRDAGYLNEVVVTAQRREQSLQDVPIAVTALDAAAIERKQIRDTLDVIYHIPNLIGNNNVGLGTSNTYFIRGVGNTESIATQDAPVATYVDEVYISRQNANNFGLFDVERIEVLRGPQGTLFGRNTTGGAINIIMSKPSPEFGGYFEGAGGSYGLSEFRGSVDVPVTEQLLTKLSGFKVKDDGYARQLLTGRDLNGRDSFGIRGATRWLATDSLTLDLTAELQNDRNANLINLVDPVTGDRIVPTGITKDALAGFFTGEKRFNEPGNEVRTNAYSAKLEWDLGAVTLASITGYRDTLQRYYIDSVSIAPNPVATGVSPIVNIGTHRQWTQEIKAAGLTAGDRLNYVFGLFYLDEDNNTDLGTGTRSAAGVFTVTGDRTIVNTLSSAAAYAQADYRFADAFTATLGLRYTDETKKLSVFTNPGGRGPVFSNALIAASGIPLELKDHFLTPRVALSYEYSSELMFYVSATRGAKSGGWNGRALANNLFLPFSAEKVWSEELGVRAELFDRRLRLNATAFYADTDDVQIAAAYTDATGQRIFTTTNPADLRNYGGEIEAAWNPIPALTLEASVGIQNAEYTNISAAVESQQSSCRAALAANNAAGITAACNRGFVDFAGRIATPVRAPDLSAVTAVSYELTLPQLSIRPTVNVTYNDGYAIGNAGNPDSTDGAWTGSQVLLNAGVSFRPTALPELSLTVDCDNCADRDYNVSFLSATSIYMNAPRTWSARLKYKF